MSKLREFLKPEPESVKHHQHKVLVTNKNHDFGKRMDKIIRDIHEFSVIKQVLDSTSEMVTYNGIKVKSLDCKMISVLLDDIIRVQEFSKVDDDNYVFIKRNMSPKAKHDE